MAAMGRVPEGLEEVLELPPFKYLWDWLLEHTYPLTFAELRAWQELTDRKLSRWEIETLIKLDRIRGS